MASNENRYQHSAKRNGSEVHASARQKGINAARAGRCPSNGMAEEYYEAYTKERKREER